jgi:hypothetical protein
MPIDDDDILSGRVEAGGYDRGQDFEREELPGRAGDGEYVYGGAGRLTQRRVELSGSVEEDTGVTGVSQLHPNIHHGQIRVPFGEACEPRVG